MKTFLSDMPVLRYVLMCFGFFMASLLGIVSGALLIGTLFK